MARLKMTTIEELNKQLSKDAKNYLNKVNEQLPENIYATEEVKLRELIQTFKKLISGGNHGLFTHHPILNEIIEKYNK